MENERKWTVYIHRSPSRKYYIGITSQQPEYRWKKGEGYKTNPYFYKAINKYGWDNFEHIILKDNLTTKEAKELEIRLIAFFKSNNPEYGYNITAGGDGSYGMVKSEETREKIRKTLTGRKNQPHSEETKKKMSEAASGHNNSRYKTSSVIYQFDLNGNLVKKHQGTGDAERETGIDRGGIVRCCNGKYKQAGGYIWRYEKDVDSINKLDKVSKGNLVSVCQFDLSGNYINTYPSAKEAERQTVANAAHICDCCKGKRNKSGGYVWKYKRDVDIEQVS